MKNTIVGLSVLASFVVTAAVAADAPSPVTGNISLTSKYKYRGQDQSDPTRQSVAAVQGGFDYALGSFYVGNWNSSIGFGGGTEVDLYGGYKGEISKDLGYDVGVLQYYYPAATTFNTTEIYGALSYSIVTAKASYTVSKRYFGAADNRGTIYLDLAANYEFAKGLTANAHVGYNRIDNETTYGPKFVDYKLGVTYDLGSGLSVAGAVVGANKTAAAPAGYGDVNKSRLIVTLTKSL